MIDKTDTAFTIMEEDIPAILRVCGEEKDPNLSDVPPRDLPKYLCERYWIKQWSPTKRWKNRGFVSSGGWTWLRHADLGRKLDDPGDAFFDLFLSTSKSIVRLRTWVEVTQTFLQHEKAEKMKMFIREYNDLRGKGDIDRDEFLRSLDFGPPDSRLQHEMADKVIWSIQKKVQKGCEGGSYKSLVRDHGRGLLIVGLPLWFATYPSTLTEPSTVLTDFVPRLLLGLKKIERSVLRASWCPFDSVFVLWNPTLESINEWTKVADPDFYSDPANLSWKTPITASKFYSLVKKYAPSSNTCSVRWDRYSSLDAMLADQRRRLRFPNNPRPLGPKAFLEVHDSESSDSTLHIYFYKCLFQLWLFVRINGWRGLRRWIASQFSIRRLYSRLRQSYQAWQVYRASTANSSKN